PLGRPATVDRDRGGDRDARTGPQWVAAEHLAADARAAPGVLTPPEAADPMSPYLLWQRHHRLPLLARRAAAQRMSRRFPLLAALRRTGQPGEWAAPWPAPPT